MSDFDREVGRLLSEERRADEAAAPRFRELLDAGARAIGRRTARRRIGPPVLLRALAVAAVLVAVASGVLLTRGSFPGSSPRAGSGLPPSAMAIAAWKSPTDFLLDTPGVELLRGRPSIGTGTGTAAIGLAPSPSPAVPDTK